MKLFRGARRAKCERNPGGNCSSKALPAARAAGRRKGPSSQHPLELRCGYRGAVQEPLRVAAAQPAQRRQLIGSLDALRHGDEIERRGQLDDARDQRDTGRIRRQPAHERAVDLEHIDGELREQPEGGIARAEIRSEASSTMLATSVTLAASAGSPLTNERSILSTSTGSFESNPREE